MVLISGKQRTEKSCQPERVPGMTYVRPDTSDTVGTALLPELAADIIIRLI